MIDSVLIINWGILFLRGGGETSALELFNLYTSSPNIRRTEIVCANFCFGKKKISFAFEGAKPRKLPMIIFYWSTTASTLLLVTWVKRLFKWGSLYAFEILAAIYVLVSHRRSLVICSDMYLAAFIVSHSASGAKVLLRLHGKAGTAFQKWLVRNGRFDIISNGNDGLDNIIASNRIHKLSVPLPSYFSMASAEIENKWKTESYHIVYAGRFELTKGIDRLQHYISEIVNKFPISTLSVCGSGSLLPQVETQIDALNKQGVITRLSCNLTRPEVCDVFKEAHIMILPSRIDFSPNVVREALAVGCIVVTSPEIYPQFEGYQNIFSLRDILTTKDPLIFKKDVLSSNNVAIKRWLEFLRN
jgi:glycosyltransferase involved in cell wall biosynthesis